MRTVDVIIPCYNYARYLPACVRSVLSQTGVDVRVLVIDDASTDNTFQLVRELATSDSRIEFRRHEANLGHIATYNEGLGWAAAKYLVLLSADDLLAPGSLSRAAHIMDADENVGMVYGRPVYFESDSELPSSAFAENGLKITTGRGHTVWRGFEWIAGRCRSGHNVISSPEVMVRGSVQRAVGGYRPELPHSGDLEMWLRIAAISDIGYVRGVPQAFYRVHTTSMFRTAYRSPLVDLRQRKAAYDLFFKYHRHIVPNADLLHDQANRALAREALWAACRAYDRNRLKTDRAEELFEFAAAAYANIASLPEYSALTRRKRLGPVICHRTQVFAASALAHRIRNWLWWRGWQKRGI